ncbi:MFS general substrate transporter [Viridothelium virens]|uniref:MFS general substrate transporter n=1 Tax=Viridothelium virens TaxID=1048519 RepID=A0A6A6GU58_VIRVR|nr:MFS general substrate transporter [Viridothelium virens]
MSWLCVSLLLSTLETTIVSTALVSITNELNGFAQRDWIVTSYLLTYTGFLTIYAKFSDIFGRKCLILLALLLFILFSILSGLSDSVLTLIILRAFQGLGGSGIYSMVMVITPQVVPRRELSKYMAIISSVFALASILGPLLGGAITHHSKDWRWVFYLNGPVGAVAMLLLIIFLPATAADTAMFMLIRKRVHNHAWHRVDFIGAFLLLSASVLLVFVLEEAGARFAWDSAAMISSLVCACICWILFPLWEHYVDRPQSTQEPVFLIRLLKDRMISGMMLYAFFTGFPFMVVIVNLPQRFQAINAVSPLLAGVYLMPLLLCSPLASGLSGYLVSNLKIPPFYLIVAGSILQLVGVCLLGSLPSVPLHLEKQQFGYEVIMGLGFGIGLSTILIMTPLVVEDKDMAVTMGALTQIRVLGGTLGLAICSSIFNNHVSSKLRNIIDPVELSKISDSASNINSLREPQRNQIRVTFADAYSLQMHVVAAFSGLVFLVSFLMWERHPRKVEDRNLE